MEQQLEHGYFLDIGFYLNELRNVLTENKEFLMRKLINDERSISGISIYDCINYSKNLAWCCVTLDKKTILSDSLFTNSFSFLI